MHGKVRLIIIERVAEAVLVAINEGDYSAKVHRGRNSGKHGEREIAEESILEEEPPGIDTMCYSDVLVCQRGMTICMRVLITALVGCSDGELREVDLTSQCAMVNSSRSRELFV